MPEIITPQILPHPKRGTMEIGTERIMPVWCSFRAAEGATEERPVLTVVGTDGSEDRHGSVINPDGWKIDAYMRNPVVLWQHGEEVKYPQVGKTLDARKVGGTWEFDVELLVKLWRHMDSNIAAFLWEAYRDHQMGAVSVSFMPLKWHDRDATEIPTFFAENVGYDEQELTEWSFVNVPSNRNGLAKAIERARSAGRFNDHLSRMLGYEVSPLIINTKRQVNNMPTQRERNEAFRTSVTSTFKRCWECEPYREPKPEVTDDAQKVVELQQMTSVANAHLALMNAAIEGWRNSKERMSRGNYTAIVATCMWEIEGLVWRAKEWYGAELTIDLPAFNAAEVEEIVTDGGESVARAVRSRQRVAAAKESRTGTRTKITELVRCCGCDPWEEEIPDLPSDEAARANEQAILRTIAEESMAIIETAVNGWKTAETERLRGMCRWRAFDAMVVFDDCVRYLSKWYGAELDAAPVVEPSELERMFTGFDITQTRAGAVLNRTNKDKLNQIKTLVDEILASAEPADEERKRALLAQFMRAEPPFEHASTQVNIEGESADAILALGTTLIPDEALAEKGREDTPHVTVCFGLDPATDIGALRDAIENSDSIKEMAMRGGATMTLSATAIFETEQGSHADGADVVYLAVDSPDLVLINQVIRESLEVTTSHPEYIPHITLAYVKKGEGQKFVGDETLAGTVITFTAIQFSDIEGNLTEIPLAGESEPAEEPDAPVESRAFKIRIKEPGVARNEPRAKSQTIRVLVPDASQGRGGDDPSKKRSNLYKLLLNDERGRSA